MKKNFSFLFALFLMFVGTANVFAGAYPFKITTDAENPELYSIQSGRGAAYWWTLDEADGTIVLRAYESAATQHWYFTEVTVEGVTYLQLHPYLGEGKAISYKETTDGNTKVWAVELGTEGYDSRWIFDNNGGKAPYGLKTADDVTWLSNHGGANHKMGFYGRGPAADVGTAMYFSYVKSEPVKNKAYAAINSDMYQLHQKYGLIQETSKFYCNANQLTEGSLNNLLDNKYDTYFHSAWQAQYGANERHYLQAEVSQPVKELAFYFKKRHNNNNNRPVDMTIQGSVDGVTYKDIANINSGFPVLESEQAYLSEVITASEAYKFFRFVINETNNNALTSGFPFFTYSEFYIFPNNDEVAEKIGVHKAARNVLAVNEADESAGAMYDAYITLSDVFEKGAGVFANSLLNAYNELAECYSEGKNMTSALAEFNSLVTLTSSIDLFTPVTDAASLAAGKRYVVAAAESAVAMAAQYEGATPYRQSANISKIREYVETKVAIAAEEELPYMVELVAAEKGWLLKDVVNGKFLFWEEKRSLDLTDDMSKASAFEISINEEGEAVIKIVGKDRTIRYGAEDDRFACYTTGQEAIKLYEDGDANDFFLAYPELANVFNTNQSMWMIPAVSEKAMLVVEAADAINAAGVVSCAPEVLKNAITAIEEFIAYASAMDAKYNEFKDALWACYDLQDNSTASVKVATVFAAVVDKYQAMQWSVPATAVADFDAYIAELNEAARNYAYKAAPAGDFTFDNIAVESEWNGAELGKSLTGHLYNPAAKAFLGTANSWGTQASFLENGYKWTVSSETVCDFEWLFDGAEDICEANVGNINLVPLKVVGNKKTPVAFEEGEDNGIVSTEDGIFIPKTTCLFLDLNEEADLKNYTLVYDVKLADVKNYTSFLQTDLENDDNDAELFVHDGKFGIKRGVPYLGYNGVFNADTWHKVVVVGNNGSISTYLDGLFIGEAGPDRTWPEAWIINKEGVYFFLDNDGEHTDVEVAGIQLWKKCLTDVEIAQMSGVKEIAGEPIPARTAQWSFDDADNLFTNDANNITLSPRKVGANNTVPTEFAEGEANGVEKIEEGIYLEKTTCLFMDLSEAADLTDYTFVYDLKVADSNPYVSMFQTDLNNNNDGDLFIAKGQFGVNTSGLAYNGKVESNKWHRLAFVSKGSVLSVYIDGVYLKSAASANAVWTINKEGVYLFLDESGEHTAVSVGGVQFWNQALSNAHIAAMGAAFAEDADVKVEVPAAAAPTYTMSGPLCHPSNVNQHYLNNGYGDGLAEAHTFTLVGKNTYAIQNSKGKYYGYKAGTTVVQLVDNVDESCYWQFVTEEEFRGEFAEATYENPVNATFAIAGQGFGYNNTEAKLWTGAPSFGGEYYNYIAEKTNVDNCEFSYVVRHMPSGVYRMRVQGFYRMGDAATAVEYRKNGQEVLPAKFYANGDSVTVMSIIDEAGNYTATTHGGMYGDYGKCPWSNRDASIYFNAGLYDHEIVFTLAEGVDTIKIGMIKNGGVANDWIAMDNYRLEYLGAKNNVDFMGNGILTAMTEGEKYVYYTDANGDHHFLYAAGANNWVLVDEPTTIKFSNGNTSAGTFAPLASHMESNGLYMSNQEKSDGTGPIATHAPSNRDCESQVFYKNVENKYAIRITNSTAETWGCFKFANVDPETLSVFASEPSLSDALYIWNITEEAPEPSAIEEVEAAEVANRAYYTLGGVLIDEPVQGVNIVKTTYTNGKVEIQKIYVK